MLENYQLFSSQEDLLGESPVWHAASNSLYWVDWLKRYLYRKNCDDGVIEGVGLDQHTGAFAFCKDGRLILNQKEGLALLDWDSQGVEPLLALPMQPGEIYKNDAKCDARGRFWFGTISDKGKGRLMRYDPCDGSLSTVRDDVYTSNGLGWTEDGKVFYYADSGRRVIWKCAYDLDTGELGEFSLFADFSSWEMGNPDGLAVDIQGNVWVAMWDASCVLSFCEEGRIEQCLELPIARPTSCAFGGPDLRTLFVTSASVDVGRSPAKQVPRSGNVFCFPVSVPGVPVGEFGV